jgi:tetratricopeptide (TPR) repeat protein
MKVMFRNIALYSAFLIFFAVSLSAQENPKIKKADFRKSDDAAFQSAWDQLKIGEKHYGKGKVQYATARKAYLEAFQYNSNNSQLNYKLGITYLFTDEKAKALTYLQKAYSENNNVSNDILYIVQYFTIKNLNCRLHVKCCQKPISIFPDDLKNAIMAKLYWNIL